jgi:hypothetical protein
MPIATSCSICSSVANCEVTVIRVPSDVSCRSTLAWVVGMSGLGAPASSAKPSSNSSERGSSMDRKRHHPCAFSPSGPPPLELARVDPDLPCALGRCGEIGHDGQGQCRGVGRGADDGHGAAPSAGSARISSIRSMRPRQIASYWPSRRAAVRMVVTSPDTIRSRPRRCLVTRCARSSTATCFCTAAKLMSWCRARVETEASSRRTRVTMSRRVASERAAKIWSVASRSACRVTMWLYVARHVGSPQGVGPQADGALAASVTSRGCRSVPVQRWWTDGHDE